jgi:hypothetical protein
MDMTFNMEIDPVAVKKSLEAEKSRRTSDPRICICGHNARSHGSQAVSGIGFELFQSRGKEMCSAGRQACPCIQFEAVATCSDVRVFIFKTTGFGNNHALSKGILAAQERGKQVAPIGDWVCKACGEGAAEGKTVGPVPIDLAKREVLRPGEINALLCGECLVSLRAGTLFP